MTDRVVNGLVRALSLDYAEVFSRSFANPEAVALLKNRLRKQLDGIAPEYVLEAYETWQNEKPSFMPKIPELVFEALAIKGRREKAARELEHANKMALLPKPDKDGIAEIERIKLEARNRGERTKEERLAAIRQHDFMILEDTKKGLIRQSIAGPAHYCSVSYCRKAGTMTTSVSGSDTWYCLEHFRAQA